MYDWDRRSRPWRRRAVARRAPSGSTPAADSLEQSSRSPRNPRLLYMLHVRTRSPVGSSRNGPGVQNAAAPRLFRAHHPSGLTHTVPAYCTWHTASHATAKRLCRKDTGCARPSGGLHWTPYMQYRALIHDLRGVGHLIVSIKRLQTENWRGCIMVSTPMSQCSGRGSEKELYRACKHDRILPRGGERQEKKHMSQNLEM